MQDYINKLTQLVFQVCYRVRKCFMHWWTSQSEIARICASKNGCHSWAMSSGFATSLRRSKQLTTYSKIIFYPKVFSVSAASDNIIQVKMSPSCGTANQKPNPITLANLSHCLHSLRLVNVVHLKLEAIRKEVFDSSNSHHKDLLERFWRSMRPGVQRTGGLVTAEWADLGFQGKDPASDFRGMGLLGLHQLVHFAERRPSAAHAVLQESNHERRYFPFAATGINVTKFVVELLCETRLHRLLFQHQERSALGDCSSATDGPSTSAATVDSCADTVHELYCQVYEEFCRLWVERDPRDIMSFGSIFGEVKANYRERYPEI